MEIFRIVRQRNIDNKSNRKKGGQHEDKNDKRISYSGSKANHIEGAA